MEKNKFKLSNLEIIKINNSLVKVSTSNLGSAEFKFGNAVDRNILKPLVEAFELVQKQSLEVVKSSDKEVNEYTSKYHDLLKEVDALEISLEEKKKKVEEGLVPLNNEYREVLENRVKTLKEFDKFALDTHEVELYPLPSEDILESFKSVDPQTFTSDDISNLLLISK